MYLNLPFEPMKSRISYPTIVTGQNDKILLNFEWYSVIRYYYDFSLFNTIHIELNSQQPSIETILNTLKFNLLNLTVKMEKVISNDNSFVTYYRLINPKLLTGNSSKKHNQIKLSIKYQSLELISDDLFNLDEIDGLNMYKLYCL